MVKISDLPIGTKIKDINTSIHGETIIWLVAGKNHYAPNTVTLVTERIVSAKAYDAKEPNSSSTSRREYGNNRYSFSNIRQWLNSNKASNWYTAQHSSDRSPNSTSVVSYNPYSNKPGFLNNFSQQLLASLQDTDITVAKANSIDGGGSEVLTDKVFLLSKAEVGLGASINGITEGQKLALFSDNNSRKTTPTEGAKADSGYPTGVNNNYLLRTPKTDTVTSIETINGLGAAYVIEAYHGISGIRPAINIPSTVDVSGTPDVEGIYTLSWNSNPILSVTSPTDARTLYENDILNVAGTVTDTDAGNVVSVKYSINGGAARAILGSVSQGSSIAFAKNLTYKSGKLYDGATAITDTLAEGSQHNIKIWAEDDQGGKSSEITRSFYVVPNRAATLTLDAFVTRTGLINTDVVNISGKVADLDNGNVIVKYKIGNGAYTQVFSGTVGSTPTSFNFNVALSLLSEGENTLTLQAVDAYGAITQQVLTLKKEKVEEPLKTAVTYYQITPPNGTADGLQLFIERELGDLAVKVDIFMGASGITETFVPMTLASTANLANGNVEDTFSYQHSSEVSKIVVRITMTRTGTATNKAIKKISGVLT